MSRLPVVSGREIARILGKIGFVIVGRKGSHVRMKRQRGKEVLIVIVPLARHVAPRSVMYF